MVADDPPVRTNDGHEAQDKEEGWEVDPATGEQEQVQGSKTRRP